MTEHPHFHEDGADLGEYLTGTLGVDMPPGALTSGWIVTILTEHPDGSEHPYVITSPEAQITKLIGMATITQHVLTQTAGEAYDLDEEDEDD